MPPLLKNPRYAAAGIMPPLRKHFLNVIKISKINMATGRSHDSITLGPNLHMEKVEKTLMLPNLSLHYVSIVSIIYHFGEIIK